MKIIVFGHVDTGKSTLCGQILVNTWMNTKVHI